MDARWTRRSRWVDATVTVTLPNHKNHCSDKNNYIRDKILKMNELDTIEIDEFSRANKLRFSSSNSSDFSYASESSSSLNQKQIKGNSNFKKERLGLISTCLVASFQLVRK